jgi:hypothetical protein
MVGIAQYDLCAALHKLLRGKRLDGPQRADRHENRCPDGAVSGVDDTGSCPGFWASGCDSIVEHNNILVLGFRFSGFNDLIRAWTIFEMLFNSPVSSF